MAGSGVGAFVAAVVARLLPLEDAILWLTSEVQTTPGESLSTAHSHLFASTLVGLDSFGWFNNPKAKRN